MLLGAHQMDVLQKNRAKTMLRFSCREHQPFQVIKKLVP